MSCLFAMLGEETAIGEVELADLTGYSRRTVRAGLRTLQNLEIEGQKLPLVQRTGRFRGWTLTRQGYQLPLVNPQKPDLPLSPNGPDDSRGEGKILPNEGQKLPNEGQKLPLVPSSSSSSIKESTESLKESLKDKLLLPDNEGQKLPDEGQKLPLAETPQHLVEMLTKKACYPNLAKRAIRAALERGETEEEIKTTITDWLKYCASPSGKGIKTPGIVTARRLEAGVPAPDLPTANDEEEIEWIT